MKSIVILGSTGSIGKQVLEVIEAHPDTYNVVGLAAKDENLELKSQIKKFKPKIVAIGEKSEKKLFSKISLFEPIFYFGNNSLEKMVRDVRADSVVVAIPGTVALGATFEAIRQRKKIFLATNK